ncbi:MAG: DUF4215 domain-containing protein [Kofleriaceae bacterium]
MPSREPSIVTATTRQPRDARILRAAIDGPRGWAALVDADTGVTTQLWGATVAAPGAQADPTIAERAARDFLAAHLDRLAPGSSIDDLQLIANRIDGELRTVGFAQTWQGVRVLGAELYVVFGRDRLIAAGSTALPAVHVAQPFARRTADPAHARAWIRGAISREVTTKRTGDRVVVPLVFGPNDIEYRLADRFDVVATSSPGRWDVYVEPDGTPIMRVSKLAFATSMLGYDVGIRHPADRHVVAADRAEVTVDAIPLTTGADGAFSWAGSDPATVIPSVTGSQVHVVNAAGAQATGSLVAQPGQPVTWSMASSELEDAQLATYVYGTIAKTRARVMAPSLTSWLDQPLTFHVNEDFTCNAFAIEGEVHLARGSIDCENAGRLADIVLHEFGHVLHAQAIIPGIGASNAALSEGVADYFAATIVGDPQLGRGFDFTDAPVRDLDPFGTERVWPIDRDGDAHVTGLIMAGALWDLRTALIAQQGASQGVAHADAIAFGVMQRAPDIASSYVAALIADDDDADLGNGTPNQCAIAAAFGKHGIAVPGYEPTTIGRPEIAGSTVSVAVTTPAGGACPAVQVTAIELRWQLDDGSVTTTALGMPGGSWSTTLPALGDGNVLRYAITATLDDGSWRVLPDNPADPMYQHYVAPVSQIWCEPLDANPMWPQSNDAQWEWAIPPESPTAQDPSAAHTGMHLLGTDVTEDGAYRANTSTQIETPAVDISQFDHVRLQYWRHLAVEDRSRDVATIAVNGTTVWTNATDASGELRHVDREWRFHDVDLSAISGDELRVSWQLTSNGDGQLGGWSLDDICLVGTKRAVCGDGQLDPTEQCDDGNTLTEDGCSDRCEAETLDHGCCSTQRRPTSGIVLGILVALVLRRRRNR